jgi:hypothetical protein
MEFLLEVEGASSLGALSLDEWKKLGDRIQYQESEGIFRDRRHGTIKFLATGILIMISLTVAFSYFMFIRGMDVRLIALVITLIVGMTLIKLGPPLVGSLQKARAATPAFISEKGFSKGAGVRPFIPFSDIYFAEVGKPALGGAYTLLTLTDGTQVSIAADSPVVWVDVHYDRKIYENLRDSLTERFGPAPPRTMQWDNDVERFLRENSPVIGPLYHAAERLAGKYFADRIDLKFIECHLNQIGTEAGQISATFIANARKKFYGP